MGRGKARGAAMVGVIGAAAWLVAGCGESRHANNQRPQVSTRVSVTIGSHRLTVQPTRVAFGPEKSQQIPQNQNQSQPPRKTREPLNVVFVIANNTNRDATVQIRRGTRQLKGTRVLAHSPETVGAELETGTYTVSTTGGSALGRLTVGSYRASSQNDVLLP